MKLTLAILMTVIVVIINYCYMQKYHNNLVGAYTGIESFLKPVTLHRVLMATFMLVCMIAMSVYIVKQNIDKNLIFVLRRVCCYAILWPAAAIDAKEQKIPNKLIVLALSYKVVIFIAEIICNGREVLQSFISEALAIFVIVLICLICRLIIKNGICMGDVKLMIIMAMLLGGTSFFNAIFVSMWIVFIEAVWLLISRKKKKSDSIAFAPSVLIGTSISMILTGC